jgi:hypothetical protein
MGLKWVSYGKSPIFLTSKEQKMLEIKNKPWKLVTLSMTITTNINMIITYAIMMTSMNEQHDYS